MKKIRKIRILDLCLSVPPRVAEAPSNLRHFIVVSSEGLNVSANVSWNAPLSALPIAAYQVDWSQLNAFNRRSFTVSKVLALQWVRSSLAKTKV